ncbi:MAG: glutamine--fructose-6-phosphate transaminase (isomerizing) [Spiribacter salinus]|uniref:Glutamine--fructose-6-phosphate aminotransferase [isomerizing] n=1 Tax=Spiribacter salinus TaxID=1335746 RepID=A0A540VNA4_9GAMM|nr:MAG: glutamine--fructose-6-phosphate transaminase (isomerizing) [Spiribacter salinus]
MCGIVGALSERDVTPILMEGLRRLEYRGYDSAGVALIDKYGQLERRRAVGRVEALEDVLSAEPTAGLTGIAHTRWATHGAPKEHNAHPHVSGDRVGLVHNGIIENHRTLRASLEADGYSFTSDTDTEVVAHTIDRHLARTRDLHAAVRDTVNELEGAYALCAVTPEQPDRLVMARRGCPAVIGVGIREHFVASDVMALLPVTRRFIFLDDGDVATVERDQLYITDENGAVVERPERESELTADSVERGQYRHYMQKEIFEQPRAVAETLEDRIANGRVLDGAFGYQATELLSQIQCVHMVACGTSYHAALVARYEIERAAGIPVNVEIASEYRYRSPAVPEGTLFVTISQSGETADTLAAMREARRLGYAATLSICNVAESSLARESDLVLMTRAGPEIGVASTKAFTTQLAGLSLLMLVLARGRGLERDAEATAVEQLATLPRRLESVLTLDEQIAKLAEFFVDKHHALFLGRGAHYPIAMEGALKLKEISYIHAEAYAAGELKHGPLALVDEDMPVVAVAPNDVLLEKLSSNLQEVRARGGRLVVFADEATKIDPGEEAFVIHVPEMGGAALIDPSVFTIPLQLLAYHVALLKGTDVDKPRNLAKSVTVE